MKICAYGCGQEAKHQFKNGKWCCSKNISLCPAIKNKISLKNSGNRMTFESRKKISNSKKGCLVWNKGKTGIYSNKTLEKMSRTRKELLKDPKNNPMIGKRHSEYTKKLMSNKKKGKCLSKEHINNIIISYKLNGHPRLNKTHTEETKRKISKSKKLNINKIKHKYLFFSRIEEMRYNPDKPDEKEIQVHCKNHNCPNSKEKGGWFTPTPLQLYERIRQLEHNGMDLSYFYCSNDCKIQCPLYKLKSDPFKVEHQYYLSSEYKTFREHILKRDNYKCQYCGKKAEHVHHERPQKLEPFFALDPDLAWSVCSNCHYSYGHKDECSTGKLASKICI